MAKRLLENVKMGGSGCSSYLGSIDGVLRGCGLWNDDFFKLAGMTGMAFHFIVHESLCPSSVTVYDWQQEHLTMMDRIGICSEVFQVNNDGTLNTYKKIQENAILRIKESIDKGIGVVYWAPTPILEFGIIRGYDDTDEIFMIQDCTGAENPDPLLYSNLGKSEVPILFYQIIEDNVDVPLAKIYRDSLQYGIKEWEKEFHVSPHYASGREGYINLITALEKNDYNSFGLSYIINSYSDAKRCIQQYLAYLGDTFTEMKGLNKAAEIYQQIVTNYQKMEQFTPFTGPGSSVEQKYIPDILELIKKSKCLEEQAMEIIKKVLEI